MELSAIQAFLQAEFGFESQWEDELNRLTLPADQILPVCAFLWKNPATYFDSLSCITAIDQGPEAGKMEPVRVMVPAALVLTVGLVQEAEVDKLK